MASDFVFECSTCKHWLGTSANVKRDLFNIITLCACAWQNMAYTFIKKKIMTIVLLDKTDI